MNSLQTLKSYFETEFDPLISNICIEDSHYQYLQYTGCGAVQITQLLVEEILLRIYSGLFWKGVEISKFNELVGSPDNLLKLVIPCLHNPNLYQFDAINEDVLIERCKQEGFTDEQTQIAINFQKSNIMSHEQVTSYVISIYPKAEMLFNIWNKSTMKNFTLTSVGIAIAHANLRRKISSNIDLSIWIRE